MHQASFLIGGFFLGSMLCGFCFAQEPASGKPLEQAPLVPQQTDPPAEPAADADADSTTVPKAMPAVVLDVAGRADWAAAGTSPLAGEGWTAIKAEDQLAPGMLIRTGLRSHVTLRFGETTVVSVRSISFASIDQFYRSATQERVRVGLGYGTVRGGSSEGTIESDVVVDTPVATLAKRGTEGWQIFVEPGTGRFEISLAEHGLVEAMAKLTGDRAISRSVRPGEYATHANIAKMWIEQDIFDRKTWVYDASGLSEAEADFAAREGGGLAAASPSPGAQVAELTGRRSGDFASSIQSGRTPPNPLPPGFDFAGPIDRPEGNFGTAAAFKARR